MKQKKQLKLSELKVQSFVTLTEDNADQVKGGIKVSVLGSNCINTCAVPCEFSVWLGGQLVC